MGMAARSCVATLLAIFLPPIAVLVQRGCGCQLLLNIILTLCGFLPGMIHALFIICMTDDDAEKGLPVAQPAPAQTIVVHTPVANPAYPAGATPGAAPHPSGAHYPAVPPPVTGVPAGYPPQAQPYPPGPAGYPPKS